MRGALVVILALLLCAGLLDVAIAQGSTPKGQSNVDVDDAETKSIIPSDSTCCGGKTRDSMNNTADALAIIQSNVSTYYYYGVQSASTFTPFTQPGVLNADMRALQKMTQYVLNSGPTSPSVPVFADSSAVSWNAPGSGIAVGVLEPVASISNTSTCQGCWIAWSAGFSVNRTLDDSTTPRSIEAVIPMSVSTRFAPQLGPNSSFDRLVAGAVGGLQPILYGDYPISISATVSVSGRSTSNVSTLAGVVGQVAFDVELQCSLEFTPATCVASVSNTPAATRLALVDDSTFRTHGRTSNMTTSIAVGVQVNVFGQSVVVNPVITVEYSSNGSARASLSVAEADLLSGKPVSVTNQQSMHVPVGIGALAPGDTESLACADTKIGGLEEAIVVEPNGGGGVEAQTMPLQCCNYLDTTAAKSGAISYNLSAGDYVVSFDWTGQPSIAFAIVSGSCLGRVMSCGTIEVRATPTAAFTVQTDNQGNTQQVTVLVSAPVAVNVTIARVGQSSAEIFVNPVVGNDTLYDGSSRMTPLQTLEHALLQASTYVNATDITIYLEPYRIGYVAPPGGFSIPTVLLRRADLQLTITSLSPENAIEYVGDWQANRIGELRDNLFDTLAWGTCYDTKLTCNSSATTDCIAFDLWDAQCHVVFRGLQFEKFVSVGRDGPGGGALRIVNSNVTVLDCLFLDNTAFSDGGDILVANNSFVAVSGSMSFNAHAKRNGGSIAVVNGSRVLFENGMAVVSNSARDGGVFFVDANSTLVVSRSAFEYCSAGSGAVVSVSSFSFATVLACSIEGNIALARGGVFSVQGGALVSVGNMISDNTGNLACGVASVSGNNSFYYDALSDITRNSPPTLCVRDGARMVLNGTKVTYGGAANLLGNNVPMLTSSRAGNINCTNASMSVGESVVIGPAVSSTNALLPNVACYACSGCVPCGECDLCSVCGPNGNCTSEQRNYECRVFSIVGYCDPDTGACAIISAGAVAGIAVGATVVFTTLVVLGVVYMCWRYRASRDSSSANSNNRRCTSCSRCCTGNSDRSAELSTPLYT